MVVIVGSMEASLTFSLNGEKRIAARTAGVRAALIQEQV